MFIGVILGILFEVVFWTIFVSVIVRAVKRVKGKNGSKLQHPPFQNTQSNNNPQCLNEDIHTDSFHTYCDYCGSSVNRGEKKCSCCGARIRKK